ncbi:uncharacterized protein LOC128672026 isoform X2 [Plodia interpunctella]|uniref:uncharacterized protein LOC128672026 isoform X2 n=1 Tax=Plodia interpunctella TaxID=58824 RepID=UPI002367AA3A|nr:uncharacterized protein LOC128672026 isoform X2 [Plodia interpunctella]
MNRNQRKYGQHSTKSEEQAKSKQDAVEEVLAPKVKSQAKPAKPMANRCCFISPDLQDFGTQQSVEKQQDPGKQSFVQQEQYQKLILEQYGFDPVLPDTLNQLKELRKVLCGNSSKVENSSQYVCPDEKNVDVASVNSGWQNIENADEIDNFIKDDKEKLESDTSLPQNVHISEIPRVKIIAEKYSKLKKNNVEVRQLDEKVVCIEYDIYKGNNTAKPKQKLRAFFAVKPIKENIQQLTDKFDIKNEDLNKLNRKEIEIIDNKIQENKPYLEDLRRILKRNQAIYTKKNKTSLDLLSLYEMAKKESPPDENFSHTNFLSKAELEEVKQLILKKCTSSVYGINRRKVRSDNNMTEKDTDNTLSNSLLQVLLQES